MTEKETYDLALSLMRLRDFFERSPQLRESEIYVPGTELALTFRQLRELSEYAARRFNEADG